MKKNEAIRMGPNPTRLVSFSGVWAWAHAFREHAGEHGDGPYKPRRKSGLDLDLCFRENQPC